jgi:hypothetical protein
VVVRIVIEKTEDGCIIRAWMDNEGEGVQLLLLERGVDRGDPDKCDVIKNPSGDDEVVSLNEISVVPDDEFIVEKIFRFRYQSTLVLPAFLMDLMDGVPSDMGYSVDAAKEKYQSFVRKWPSYEYEIKTWFFRTYGRLL